MFGGEQTHSRPGESNDEVRSADSTCLILLINFSVPGSRGGIEELNKAMKDLRTRDSSGTFFYYSFLFHSYKS